MRYIIFFILIIVMAWVWLDSKQPPAPVVDTSETEKIEQKENQTEQPKPVVKFYVTDADQQIIDWLKADGCEVKPINSAEDGEPVGYDISWTSERKSEVTHSSPGRDIDWKSVITKKHVHLWMLDKRHNDKTLAQIKQERINSKGE